MTEKQGGLELPNARSDRSTVTRPATGTRVTGAASGASRVDRYQNLKRRKEVTGNERGKYENSGAKRTL